MIGTIALAIIAASFGGVIGLAALCRPQAAGAVPGGVRGLGLGPAQGRQRQFRRRARRRGVSLKLDNPRRVVALAMIDANTPVRADTQVGLEFQGLTGIAAISFTGGTRRRPPVAARCRRHSRTHRRSGGTLDAGKDPRGAAQRRQGDRRQRGGGEGHAAATSKSFTATLCRQRRPITSIISAAESGVASVDDGFGKTQDFLTSLGSDKYGGDLLPTVISLRELIESFDKKSGHADRRDPQNAGRAQPVHQQGRPEIRGRRRR